MMTAMRKYLISLMALLGCVCTLRGAEVDYSYVVAGTPTKGWGTAKSETYAVAIRIDNPRLEGARVLSVNVPFPEGVNASDCYAFVSSELNGVNGNIGEGALKMDFTPTIGGVCRVELPEEYVVEGAFYAGYSFKIAKATSNADQHPVEVADGYVDNGMYISTSRTYRKWNSSETLGARLAMSVTVDGDLRQNDCLLSLPDQIVTPEAAAKGSAYIYNTGLTPIASIAYTYTIAGQELKGTAEFDPAVPCDFTSSALVEYDIPALPDNTSEPGTLIVTGINGEAAEVSASNTIHVMQQVPLKRVAMEELTGTWCMYCPRGWVAIELLKEEYPDLFVAMAYHNGDIMTVTNDVPVNGGLPVCDVDRTVTCDPYFGETDKTDMGIRTTIENALKGELVANIDVDGSFNADGSKINVTADVFYFQKLEDNPYRIQFVVTEDGMSGVGPQWLQSNAYSGRSGWGDEMKMFVEGGAKMEISYNDVVIGTTGYAGVEDSQPASVEVAQAASYEYEFDCFDFHNTRGNLSFPLHYDKVNVIAMLVNKNTREIVNVAKKRLSEPSAVADIMAEATPLTVEYFDISGRRLSSAPQQGIYVESAVYADGTRLNTKRLR